MERKRHPCRRCEGKGRLHAGFFTAGTICVACGGEGQHGDRPVRWGEHRWGEHRWGEHRPIELWGGGGGEYHEEGETDRPCASLTAGFQVLWNTARKFAASAMAAVLWIACWASAPSIARHAMATSM
jgi:hypothetical protein